MESICATMSPCAEVSSSVFGLRSSVFGLLAASFAAWVPSIALAACGDWTVDAGETCDDGNTITETLPYGQTSPCVVCDSQCQELQGQCQFCGDNQWQAQYELCEDGNTTTESPPYPNQSNCQQCDAQCRTFDACYWCGDNTTDYLHGETCDDGNTSGGDGCSATCVDECIDGLSITLEPTWVQAGSSTLVAGHVTNSTNVTCDTFLIPGVLGYLVLGDTSGTPGFVSVPANSVVDFEFEIIAPPNTPGDWVDPVQGGHHDFQVFYVRTEAATSDPGAINTACVIPASEQSVSDAWYVNDPLVHAFFGRIQPQNVSFNTRSVDEFFVPDGSADDCYFENDPVWGNSSYARVDAPPAFGAGGISGCSDWVVQPNNKWAPPQPTCPQQVGEFPHNVDSVGLVDPGVLTYYRTHGPNAPNCGMLFDQHMAMGCKRLDPNDPNLLVFQEFEVHSSGFVFTATDFTSVRDQLAPTKVWP